MTHEGSHRPSESRIPVSVVLCDEYQQRIHRYILGLVRNRADADDLTQETFLRAHRNIESLEDLTNRAGWLYRIATNVCYDRGRGASHGRRAQPRDNMSDGGKIGLPKESSDAPRLDLVLQQKEMSACVHEYIEQLDDDYRMVILLHDLHGMSNREIAEALGCSLATTKIRLHRAREKLRGVLTTSCEFSCDERGVLVCDRTRHRSGG